MKQLFLAIAVLMSTIIGAGIFSLPYAGAQSGFLIATALLVLLTIIMIALHLFYGEIILRTKEEYQLPGYIGKYMGENAKKIIGFFAIVGFYGSLLVYILIGGDFLYIIFSSIFNFPQIVFYLIFFVIGSIAIYFGLKLVSGWDLIMNLVLVLTIFALFAISANQIKIDNFKSINWSNIIIPYGAIAYALVGIAAIPEVKRVLGFNSGKGLRKAIIIGTLIPAVIYFVFMGTIIGLTGKNTSPEAIDGLINAIGKDIVVTGSLIGFLIVVSSFFSLGLALKATYMYDFKVKKNTAWALTCLIPIILVLLGTHNFITIIVFLGALIGATEGIAIVLMYYKVVKPGKAVKILGYFIILTLFIGFVYTIIKII